MSNQIQHSHNPQQSTLAPNPHTHTQCGTQGRSREGNLRRRAGENPHDANKRTLQAFASSLTGQTCIPSVHLAWTTASHLMHSRPCGITRGISDNQLPAIKGSVANCLLVCAISGEVGHGRFPSHRWCVRICVIGGEDINTKVYNELTL